MLLQNLPLTSINLSDDSFRITFSPELGALKTSIEAVGLTQPIHVRHTPEGTYQIVSGYKRVLALRELSRQTVAALVSEQQELTPAKAFLLNLHENAIIRTLNPVEKALALQKLPLYIQASEDELVTRYLPLMGEDPSYRVLHQLTSLNNLTEPMKLHLVATDMALSSAARIAEFTPSTQQALLAVLQHIRPSAAKLNELLTLIREIAARDALSVEDILQRYQLLTLVADPNTTHAERVKALRQTLRGIRLPNLTERQEKVASLIQGLDLPAAAKVVADPYFENEKIKLEYKFSHPEELDAFIKKLQGAFARQQWQEIFEWYRV